MRLWGHLQSRDSMECMLVKSQSDYSEVGLKKLKADGSASLGWMSIQRQVQQLSIITSVMLFIRILLMELTKYLIGTVSECVPSTLTCPWSMAFHIVFFKYVPPLECPATSHCVMSTAGPFQATVLIHSGTAAIAASASAKPQWSVNKSANPNLKG